MPASGHTTTVVYFIIVFRLYWAVPRGLASARHIIFHEQARLNERRKGLL